MRSLDFYGLTRSLQDRFIESTRGAAVPLPIVGLPIAEQRAARWGLGALAAVVAWVLFVSVGFGDLRSPLALGGVALMVPHILFASVFVYCALRGYAATWEAARAPYADGLYLFPAALIEARFETLTEHGVSDIRSLVVEGATLTVELVSGRRVSFPAGTSERAEQFKNSFDEGKEKWLKTAESEALERARLHPLIESGVPNPLAPTRAHQRPALFHSSIFVLLSLILGVLLGAFVSYSRNLMSEKALYRAAIQADTVDAYRAYLMRGGKRHEVGELFLPRAELKRAMEKGTVEAIEEFSAKNPATKIAEEVRSVHRAALLSELATAQKTGSLAAIEEIRRRYPAHSLIEPELAAARKAAFDSTLLTYRTLASPKHPELLAQVERLIAYAEAHGPKVKIRWVHEFPQSRDMLDSIVSKSEKYYFGRRCLPTQYFFGEKSLAREKAFTERLIQRLSSTFSKEVLEFELVGLGETENEKPPEDEGPRLLLTHQENLSGGFVGGKPKTMILGATMVMTARLEVPGSEPATFRFQAWRAPDFSEAADPEIPAIYEAMIAGAYDEFARAYLAAWFSEP